ncbi:FGGY carbohydrate kinase domain-containing protein-like [Xenopus laevis]|uniref:FGGY carbohydrate kinase domain-containing protein-like n=1 Tax=Xenopus laevis TaxID=8355 RepID=A0A8J1N145_XENLA|nr:FGGY carbohydrate kinase domain-containing protein-like [Xenopus laevis]
MTIEETLLAEQPVKLVSRLYRNLLASVPPPFHTAQAQWKTNIPELTQDDWDEATETMYKSLIAMRDKVIQNKVFHQHYTTPLKLKAMDHGWDDKFWKQIGLDDICEGNYVKIGNQVMSHRASTGNCLTATAAKDLGLPEGLPVAVSLIDAHARGLVVIGASLKEYGLKGDHHPITSRLALICGTSLCNGVKTGNKTSPLNKESGKLKEALEANIQLAVTAKPPGKRNYQSSFSFINILAVLEIDHTVHGHSAFIELENEAKARGQHIYTYLYNHLDQIKKSGPVGFLAVDLHVWPDFHGNSPLADLTMKGMVVGLTLSKILDDLAILYLATIQAIALGTRHILETMQTAGHHISTLHLSGGLSKNPLFVQMHYGGSDV